MASTYPFNHECKPGAAVEEWCSNSTAVPPPAGIPLTVRCVVCGVVMWQTTQENSHG